MPSKYSSGDHRRQVKKPTGPHPVWNALGCIMLIVIPIMSIALAIYLVELGLDGVWPIPPDLLKPIILPDWIYAAQGLASILLAIVSVDYLLAYVVISIVVMIVLGGIISLFYSILHSIAGPSRYGPLDARPTKSKPYRR